MVNIRRLPGVFYTHKIKFGLLSVIILSVVYFIHHWGIVCTNYETKREIERLCKFYEKGEAMGNLCKPLCTENEIHSITCTPQHSGKEFVFTAKWKNTLIVFKSSYSNQEKIPAPENKQDTFSILSNSKKLLNVNKNNTRRHLFTLDNVPRLFPRHSKNKMQNEDSYSVQKLETYPRHFPLREHKSEEVKIYKRRKRKSAAAAAVAGEAEEDFDVKEIGEKDFEKIIRDIISEKLNVSVSNSQVEGLKYLETKNKFLYSESSQNRKIEKSNVYKLLQSQEYLMSHLFSDREVFPQILGTCGHFYGVEYLKSPQFNSFFMLDNKEEWSERMKLAILIMDFVEELETNFPDALHLCDIKMSHFGVTNTGRLKFLDLDSVYTNNVIEKMVSSGRACSQHKDCDIFDCKSTCNSETNICDGGVANNNLQVICEKIFIGWTMSGKVIVPGLLMSEHTPASLAALLRICAENDRAPVPEDVRQKLYTTLTEMYQILTQKLFM